LTPEKVRLQRASKNRLWQCSAKKVNATTHNSRATYHIISQFEATPPYSYDRSLRCDTTQRSICAHAADNIRQTFIGGVIL